MTLPYWIEKGTNTVWTKVNIPANNSVVLTVKKNGTTQPNPDDVFEFFDDFEDLLQWEIIRGDNNSVIMQNSYLKLIGGASGAGGLTVVRTNTDLNLPDKYVIKSKVIADDWNEMVGIGVSYSSDYKTGTDNVDILNNGYDFAYWGWGGTQHAMRTVKDGTVIVDDHSAYQGFFSAQNGVEYYIGGKYNGQKLYHFKPTTDGTIIIDHSRDDTTFNNQQPKRIYLYVWQDAAWKYDWIFIRKYVDIEPTVQVEQVTTYEYRVKITNQNSYELTDFQVGFKIDGITDSDKLDISYYIPEGKQITYDEVSNTIIIVGGTEENPVSFTDLIIADDSNGWGVIDTDENGNYVIDATIQVGDGITQTYFKTVNSTLLFTVYGTDYPLLNVKQNADCVLENTKIATLSQLDSIYEQLENIRNEISDVNSDLDSIKTDIHDINNTLSNLRVDLPESIKQMIAYIFNAVKRLGI